MDDADYEDLLERRDVRRKKEKKRHHKSAKDRDESAKESFKKMKEELDELRKKENERSRELDELKKMIGEKEIQSSQSEFELGFDKNVYLSKGFIESAQWIQNCLAKRMVEKMNEDSNKEKFSKLVVAKNSSTNIGYRACARFNRSEVCDLGKWHLSHKPDGLWTTHGMQRRRDCLDKQSGTNQTRRNELRLHVCTLCLEALGAAMNHCLLDCPWILKKNWS